MKRSRRDFLKGLLGLAAGAVAAQVAPGATPTAQAATKAVPMGTAVFEVFEVWNLRPEVAEAFAGSRHWECMLRAQQVAHALMEERMQRVRAALLGPYEPKPLEYHDEEIDLASLTDEKVADVRRALDRGGFVLEKWAGAVENFAEAATKV